MCTYNADFAQNFPCMYAYKDVSVPKGRVVHGSRAVLGAEATPSDEEDESRWGLV